MRYLGHKVRNQDRPDEMVSMIRVAQVRYVVRVRKSPDERVTQVRFTTNWSKNGRAEVSENNPEYICNHTAVTVNSNSE